MAQFAAPAIGAGTGLINLGFTIYDHLNLQEPEEFKQAEEELTSLGYRIRDFIEKNNIHLKDFADLVIADKLLKDTLDILHKNAKLLPQEETATVLKLYHESQDSIVSVLDIKLPSQRSAEETSGSQRKLWRLNLFRTQAADPRESHILLIGRYIKEGRDLAKEANFLAKEFSNRAMENALKNQHSDTPSCTAVSTAQSSPFDTPKASPFTSTQSNDSYKQALYGRRKGPGVPNSALSSQFTASLAPPEQQEADRLSIKSLPSKMPSCDHDKLYDREGVRRRGRPMVAEILPPTDAGPPSSLKLKIPVAKERDESSIGHHMTCHAIPEDPVGNRAGIWAND